MTELALADYRRPGRLGLVRAYLAAMTGIVRRDAAIRLSYRGSLVTENLGIVFMLASFFYIAKLVRVAPFHTPAEYFAYVVVGVVVLGMIYASLSIPAAVRQELVAGTYERLVLSPFGGAAATASLMIFPILFSVAVAILQVLVAVAVFGLHIRWETAGLALPLGIVGALAFAPFALLFAAATVAFKHAPGQTAGLGIISLASGMYFPVALLPWWLRWISDVQPLTPTVDVLRHVLIGFPLRESPAAAFAKIAGFIVIGIPIALWFVSLAGKYARRRGTVIEY